MRLVVISFCYAPQLNARAIRWTALAEEFARCGHEVRVITSWRKDLPTEEDVNGVHVYRAGVRLAERMRALLAARRAPVKASPEDQALAGGTRPAGPRLLAAINHGIWRSLWWPDSTCVWLPSALRRARTELARQEADALITVSPSFSAVLAGLLLARENGRCGRWIVDLGDPFSFQTEAPPNNYRLYGRLNRSMERRAFNRASAVSVTTPQTRDIYAGLYPESTHKIRVIPPLLDTVKASAAPFFSPNAAVRLLFVGTLYRGIRRPDGLLALFDALVRADSARRYELHFIGETQACADAFLAYSNRLGDRLVIHPPLPRADVARATLEANILVNIGNDTAYQLPSKLVEYIATGKPIISITRTEHDMSAEFLRSYPAALCLNTGDRSPGDNDSAFVEFCRRRHGDSVDPAVVEALLRPHTTSRIAAQYEELLRSRHPGLPEPCPSSP